jgi:hypothetical protein
MTNLVPLLVAVFPLFAVGLVGAQTSNPQLDELISKVKPRAEVLNSTPELILQAALPPQYAQCLYAAFSEAGQNNNVAHSYLLDQIDFLVSTGLKPSRIQGVLAYGHALTNMSFASSAGKPVDKVGANDLKERQNYIYRTFIRLACVNSFSDQRVQPALRELIKATRVNETPR